MIILSIFWLLKLTENAGLKTERVDVRLKNADERIVEKENNTDANIADCNAYLVQMVQKL